MNQLFEMGVFGVSFSGGEPLCRTDIFEIMSRAREHGLFFSLKTNGTLITEPIADRLKELGVSGAAVSLYGATPETHDYVTRVAGSHVRTIRAVKLLRERKIRVGIKSSIMSCNVGEDKEMENIARELGADYEPNPVVLPKIGQPGSNDYLRMDDERLRTFVQERNWIIKDAEANAKKADLEHSLICTAGRLRCAISPQGEVFPCVVWRMPMGNLRQKSFRDVWYGEAARSIRSIKVSDRSVCASCELVGYCLHCPGQAYEENGTISGPSSENCRLARVRKEVSEEMTKKTYISPGIDSEQFDLPSAWACSQSSITVNDDVWNDELGKWVWTACLEGSDWCDTC
jgi:radical SAM protein with 4Fe4S-binding SPASM domain